MAHLGLAAERACIVRELLHQLRREVVDVHPPAARAPVAEEGEHTVALGDPAILGDELGERLGRQRAVAVPAREPADEGGVERRDAHRVLQARADVADSQLDRWECAGRANVPPKLSGISYVFHAPIFGDEPLVFGPGVQRAGQAGARQGAHHGETK